MENEKTILKADIRRTSKKALIIWYILCSIAFFIGTFVLTLNSIYKSDTGTSMEFYLFFCCSGYRYEHMDGSVISSFYLDRFIMGVILFLVVLFLPIIITLIANSVSKQCSISLTDKGVTGHRKTLFSAKVLKLPIDKIDSIMASHSFLDTLRGGDTLLIRSASGIIKFPWVQNAGEFVNATLAKIEEFKQSVKDENNNLVSAMINNSGNNSGSSSAAQQIKEIKDLLDNGLISQEEFEAKRKELLDKI